MTPTFEQIRTAAYDRWERRARAHGHDRADWLAAERQQRLARNYRLMASYRLDGADHAPIGDRAGRRCRFCCESAPRASFPEGLPLFPRALGSATPVAYDQCADCASTFAEGIDGALTRFLALDGTGEPSVPGIAAAAFKGLVKLALAIMPARDLEDHEGTLEWVTNPDHDFDLNVFRGLSCVVHVSPGPLPSPWAALARKTDDREPWPARLFFLGSGPLTCLVPVPLNPSDEDLDITAEVMPDVMPPSPFGPEHDPIARFSLPIVSTAEARVLASRS